MINLFNTNIESLSIHKVGNKSRNEKLFISKNPFALNDEITPLLKEYFFKTFREKEESYYRFYHEVDLEYNSVFCSCRDLFENPDKTHELSKNIAQHLFEQSNHPHIKSGELYVLHLTNLSIDNEIVDAIGIFKSEIRSDFMQFNEKENYLELVLQQGVNLQKLDKGALIFNTKKDDGYKVLCIDTNRYDTRYWLEHFLELDIFQDENFTTKKYLQMVKDFGKEVVRPAEDKKEETLFLNRSINHFAKNDEFNESVFLNEVVENPDLIAEFKNYKSDKGEKYSIEDVSDFAISNTAVNDMRKKFKSLIELDTNISIKIDLMSNESAQNFIEKGWDEEKQMYYYLVYFNKELK